MEEKSTDDHKEEHWNNLKLIVGEIRTIIGGSVVRGSYKSLRKAVQEQVNSVLIRHPIEKHHHIRNDNIVFSERDVKGIKQLQDGPFVIMLTIEGCNTRRVLVDNGSSTDAMYMTAFQQMKLDPKHLRPFKSPLVSFITDYSSDLPCLSEEGGRLLDCRLPFIL